MKAWLCDNPIGPQALRRADVPAPEPAAGQVRIAVRAASLNFPDLLIVQNKYQVKPPLPFVPGAEFSGLVDAVGRDTVALQFGQWNEPIVLLISLSAINFVMGNVLDPWLMAGSLNLSPAVILMSLAAWTTIWGIAGAFLAVPGTVALTIIFSAFSSTRPLALLLTKDDVASPAE